MDKENNLLSSLAHTTETEADPTRKFRGWGDFSNIWQSSFSWQSSLFPNCTKSWWKKLLS